MLDYSISGAPGAQAVVWNAGPLQPLGGGVLTPLSASVLSELMRRAWFAYYDRLGFEPAPLTKVARVHAGRLYLNQSISAQMDAQQAGLVPQTLTVNGGPLALATVEKPGFLAGFKVRGKRKQVEQLADTLLDEAPTMIRKAEEWCGKTLEMRWSQAEVLQIMEEIESVGLEGMTAFFAARHHLERLYNGILRRLTGPVTARVLLLNNALSDLRELVEVEMVQAVVEMSHAFAADSTAAGWFGSCEARHWEEDDPGPAVRRGLEAFLERYGHRGLNEGELANPRWYEDRDPILRVVHGCIKYGLGHPAKIPAAQAVRHLVEAVHEEPGLVERELAQIRQWHKVQSRALHALAYIWAGTRRWALAAAHEAGADERVQSPDDIFFFELEEIKRMMTGEWNISELDDIHAVCAARKTQYAEWRTLHPGPVLLGDAEAASVAQGVGAVGGHVVGPLHHWRETRKNGCDDAIAASPVLDSGWAIVLPVVHGAVSEHGSPLDPFVCAARVWNRPTVVGLGAVYEHLIEGAQTTINTTAEGEPTYVAQ